MSPETGELLATEVVPRIRSMAHSLNPIASEDHNELIQDAIVIGAQLLVSAKARAKPVSPATSPTLPSRSLAEAGAAPAIVKMTHCTRPHRSATAVGWCRWTSR